MAKTGIKLKPIAGAKTSGRGVSTSHKRIKSDCVPAYFKLSEMPKGLETAFEVAASINASLDHNTIIQSGLQQLKRFIKADSWTIYLTETEHRRAELNRLDSGNPISALIDSFPQDSLL